MLEKFTIKHGCKPLSTGGVVRYSYLKNVGNIEINYSTLLTRLIQEAGRYCESYASDLFISWQSVLERLSDFERLEDHSTLFGFRESGVDTNRSVLYYDERESLYVYRSIWRLDIEVERSGNDYKDVTMTLYRVR